MRFSTTNISGVYKIDLEKKTDHRGFFARMFCKEEFAELGLQTDFCQLNTSYSPLRGTLRGIHYQREPSEEAKLVKCLSGCLFDVVLDLRVDSPTYCKHQTFEIDSERRSMVYIPKGCAHGFMTLCPDTEIMYLVSEAYTPGAEAGIRFDDPCFGIEWPMAPKEISIKDASYDLYRKSSNA